MTGDASESKNSNPALAEVRRLVEEQKYSAAFDEATKVLSRARAAKDQRLMTEALLQMTQLQLALGGYETAVRTLRTEVWPTDELERTLLNLYYASALSTYRQSYRWEINRREKIVSIEQPDVQLWTGAQIGEEILRAFNEALKPKKLLSQPTPDFYASYLSKNSYPAAIRPTLRDAIVYLAAAQLRNSSDWTAAESNEVYMLPLARLARGEAAPQDASLSDSSLHPLVRLASLLNAHREFHRAAGRNGAASEARYELLRALHASAGSDEARAQIREALIQLQNGRRDEWWSVGQALLAEFYEADSTRADRLVLAVRALEEGVKQDPKSHGGLVCEAQKQRLLLPSLSVESMVADGAKRASIKIRYRHLNKIYFRAYAWDIASQIGSSRGFSVWNLPGRDGTRDLLSGKYGAPAAEWEQALPETTDHLGHVSLNTTALSQAGGYFIVASSHPQFLPEPSATALSTLLITDLVLDRVDRADGQLEVRALNGTTGQPVAGVSVQNYVDNYRDPVKLIETKTTDAKGRVLFRTPTSGGAMIQFARKGTDLALLGQPAYGSSRGGATPSSETFLFTDRSVFRPEQTVQWKAVYFRGDRNAGQFKTVGGESLNIELIDANGQTVSQKKVKTNEFGSAAGEFKIPAGRALGDWRLVSSGEKHFGSTSIKVEEYKRPTFEAAILDAEKPLRLNQPASLSGEAKYYFGTPVSGGRVVWRVKRRPIYPIYWWGYRAFNENNEQIVAAGTSTLGEDGRFKMEFTPRADEAAKSPGLSFNFELQATITDEGGETREAVKSVRLGFVSREVFIEPAVSFFRERAGVDIPVRLADLNGAAREGRGEWRIVEVEQPAKTLLPSELPRASGETTPRARWETDFDPQQVTQSFNEGRERAKGSLVHDKDGRAIAKLDSGLEAGLYRFIYEGKDDFGASLGQTRDFIVAGAKNDLRLPILLIPEKASYDVGQTARFIAQSGWPDQTFLVEVYRDSRVVREVEVRGGTVIEIPVTEKERGGFSVQVRGLREYQSLTTSTQVSVPWTNQELAISLSSFRDRIRPGATETFRVNIKSRDGKQLPAKAVEVLAYMYDRSLDFFREHQFPRPLALFPSRTGAPGVTLSLGSQTSGATLRGFPPIANVPYLSPDQLSFHASYGIGGPGRRGGLRSRGGEGSGGMFGTMAMSQSRMEKGAGLAATENLAEQKAKSFDAAPAMSLTSGPVASAPQQVRSNFAETAFWQPQLLNAADGSVAIEFKVPDSLTSWNFWIHAITKDLRSASLNSETRSAKELMVRPYLPRFLREGDDAEVRVAINNTSDKNLEGTVKIEITDADSGADRAADFALDKVPRAFKISKAGSMTVTYKLRAPRDVRAYAFKVTAQAGDLSDGELRALPVLPSRLHLAQSRFVTLRENQTKTIEFKDLASSRTTDPSLSSDRMVVTVDAQLFYGVLQALPYLVTYPYECTEQTLNRFLSTGIVSSVFKKYPAVEKMAREFSARKTQLEKFDGSDPNQRMTLEESPWLSLAKGGESKGLSNVLDSRLALAERDRALTKLRKAQLPTGGFPWFEGGRESEYITLYLLLGFARANEFNIDVPKDMIARAWGYLKTWRETELRECMSKGGCLETATLLSFALSSYPDLSWTGGQFNGADQKALLEYSFAGWKKLSPLLKGYLSLALLRSKRADDARLVWASVMDSSKSDQELGTYWAPEARSWLWYNDTIETHAFALRTQMELAPKDKRNDGLVQWLFLNKKLNHWKSTRATAESIYALVHFLDQTAALGKREAVTVTANSKETKFVFEPEAYTGAKNQIVIAGPEVTPATAAVQVAKSGPGFAFASATWHFATDKLPTEGNGDLFSVERRYFKRELQGSQYVLKPLKDGDRVRVGEQVEVQISLRAKQAAEYVHLRDPRGAGFEPESVISGYKYDLGLAYYQEVRDSGANFFFNWLPVGEYPFRYRVRANMAGKFRVGPATVQSLYAPEFNAYSAGAELRVEP